MKMRTPLLPTFLLFSVLLAMPSLGFFLGSQTRTVCVNSPNSLLPGQQPPPTLPGQAATIDPGAQVICVRCAANRYTQISTICTGQPSVPPTTSQNQAFCLISNCIQQNPQKAFSFPGIGGFGLGGQGGAYPGLPGRKRRHIVDQNEDEGAFTNVDPTLK